MNIVIGSKIKNLRLSADLTQAELAARAQLTKGFISQLENDQTDIALESLNGILEALGVSLSEFFSDNSSEAVIFSPAERVRLTDRGAKVFELLVPGSTNNEMDPVFVTLNKGEALEPEEAHEGEEFGYVLSGKLSMQLAKKLYHIPAKSCFYFESSKPHRLLNKGNVAVSFIWVSAPPQM